MDMAIAVKMMKMTETVAVHRAVVKTSATVREARAKNRVLGMVITGTYLFQVTRPSCSKGGKHYLKDKSLSSG